MRIQLEWATPGHDVSRCSGTVAVRTPLNRRCAEPRWNRGVRVLERVLERALDHRLGCAQICFGRSIEPWSDCSPRFCYSCCPIQTPQRCLGSSSVGINVSPRLTPVGSALSALSPASASILTNGSPAPLSGMGGDADGMANAALGSSQIQRKHAELQQRRQR